MQETSKKINETEKFTITSLTVSGPINSKDVLFLREMAGRDIDGKETKGKLSSLDLSDAKIVMGGGNYYKVKRGLSTKYYNIKENDVVDSHMFYNCRSLTSLKLPKTVKKIELYAMQYCKSLQNALFPRTFRKLMIKLLLTQACQKSHSLLLSQALNIRLSPNVAT